MFFSHSDIPEPASEPIFIGDPAEVFGVLPYLVGYRPAAGDVVIAGIADGRIAALGNAAFGSWTAEELAVEILVPLHHRGGIDGVLIAAYGGPAVDAKLCELALLIRAAGYAVDHVLRTAGDRAFCLACQCCGPHGRAFDPDASTAAAQAVFAGHVALPSRQAMLDQIAFDPDASATLDPAINDAAGKLLDAVPTDQWATEFIDSVMDRARAGERIDDATAATFILLLVNLPWRDHAWLATDSQPHLAGLWRDLTRRCPRHEMFAAVPVLAAWSAWRSGNITLAGAATDLALELDPGYRLAQLIRQVLLAKLPPSRMPWPPDETAPDHDLPVSSEAP